jgi:AbrB family looped-hinge helix DNA binding protein
MDKILGDSRVQPNFRVTLTKEVRRRLRVKVGDTVAYSEDQDGNVVIRKAELRPV